MNLDMLLLLQGTTSTEYSEGIQIEYIAIFVALFPGALVAFNYDLLQSFPRYTALRIYCAGIWHNAVFCAACALMLFLLPYILFPFYIHGENPMVLDVKSSSTLSAYLSPGDVIISLDGLQVHDPQEWMEKLNTINAQVLQNSHHSQDLNNVRAVSGRKGYCIPSSWMKDQEEIQLEADQSSCLNGLTPFAKIPCHVSNMLDEGNIEYGHQNSIGHCLSVKNVVKLKKCGNGWPEAGSGGSICLCSQEETCLMPVLMPGLVWVEIMYRHPYSSACVWPGWNSSLDFGGPESRASNCGETFVFIGRMLSIESSVQLTAYQPRLAFPLAMNIPSMIEKLCACTFHVSLTLALLNSLPVFLLDGESIMEVTIGCFRLLSPWKRAKVLQICLLGGTILSIIAFARAMFNFL